MADVLEADTAAAELLDTVVEATLLDVAAVGEALVVAADALAVVAAEIAVLAVLVALVTAVGTGAALLGAAELVAAEVLAVTEAAPPHAARTPIAGKATAAPSACRRSVRREVKDEPGMPTPPALTNTDIVTDPDLRSPTTTSRLNHAS